MCVFVRRYLISEMQQRQKITGHCRGKGKELKQNQQKCDNAYTPSLQVSYNTTEKSVREPWSGDLDQFKGSSEFFNCNSTSSITHTVSFWTTTIIDTTNYNLIVNNNNYYPVFTKIKKLTIDSMQTQLTCTVILYLQ